jgi:hypothetical protein
MLVCQVKFAAVLEQEVVESLFFKFAQAVVAGNEDFGGREAFEILLDFFMFGPHHGTFREV